MPNHEFKHILLAQKQRHIMITRRGPVAGYVTFQYMVKWLKTSAAGEADDLGF